MHAQINRRRSWKQSDWLKEREKKSPNLHNGTFISKVQMQRGKPRKPDLEKEREKKKKKTVIITFLNGNEKEEIC